MREPRVPSARITTLARRSYPGSKFAFGWPFLSTPLSSVRTPATRLFSISNSDPAKPVKIVMPAASTFSPIHFAKRFSEIT